MTDLPFEQWHPDAQRQCGFWWDLSPIACGQCERCRKEQQFHAVSPLGKALADFGDKLVAAQAELPPEVAQVLREHRWNLYEGEPVTPHPTGAGTGSDPQRRVRRIRDVGAEKGRNRHQQCVPRVLGVQ